MGVFQNHLMGAAAAAAGASTSFYDYQIEQSCRFENASNSSLERATAFSAITTFTFSTWVKRGGIGEDYKFFFQCKSNQGMGFADTNAITILNGSSHALGSALFRDASAWMHVVLKVTSGTGQLYVNNDTLHTNTSMSLQGGDGTAIQVGNYGDTNGFSGYLAETILIDGSALNPTSFAENHNGVWRPIDPSGLTFGTQGFWLKYENSGDLGNDSSGNNNDYTAANLAADHQVLDSPTS